MFLWLWDQLCDHITWRGGTRKSVRLEVEHTNNQVEYRALVMGLEALMSMGVKDVEACGDSQLMVQQVLRESQCSNNTLNQYLELCKQLVRGLDTFSIRHVGREDNKAANRLAQQAFGYEVRRGKISVLEEPISCGAINADESAVTGENNTTDEDWRVTLQRCIMDLGGTRDRKVLRQALKYTVLDGELYRMTIDGVILKCLSGEQIKVAMGEVHEGMCGTHQSAHKMKWMLKRAGFYWPTMVADCFKYFKGCEACQCFGDVQLALASMMHPVIKP
jgi:ribonuclease HI